MSEVRRYTYTVDPVYDRESLIPMNRASEHFAPQGQYVSGSDHDAAVNVLWDELGAVKGEYDRAVNKVDALVESLTVACAGVPVDGVKDPMALPDLGPYGVELSAQVWDQIHQRAFELGGTDSGDYHLEASDINELISFVFASIYDKPAQEAAHHE